MDNHVVMNTFLLPARAAAAVLLACAASACGSAPAATDSAGLLHQIQAQAADLACDTSQQCHALPVGAKACGGPESYLPWSSKRQDGSALRELAARHAALRRADNAKSGMLSNCLALPEPGASCQAGRCVLGTSAQ